MIGVGVDIGGTFVKLFVMNEHGEIFRKEKVETDYSKGSKGFIGRKIDKGLVVRRGQNIV